MPGRATDASPWHRIRAERCASVSKFCVLVYRSRDGKGTHKPMYAEETQEREAWRTQSIHRSSLSKRGAHKDLHTEESARRERNSSTYSSNRVLSFRFSTIRCTFCISESCTFSLPLGGRERKARRNAQRGTDAYGAACFQPVLHCIQHSMRSSG